MYECRSGYKTTAEEKAAGHGEYIKNTVFGFPKDDELRDRWKTFVSRNDPNSSKFSAANTPPPDDEKKAKAKPETSGICANHFEERYLKRGKKRIDLLLNMNPVPTVHTSPTMLSQPSLQSNATMPRKAPTKRPYDHPLLNETNAFKAIHSVSCLDIR